MPAIRPFANDASRRLKEFAIEAVEMIKNKYYLIAFVILVADHVSKWIVRMQLYPREALEIIPGFLRLSYVHNSGVAFGLFDEVESVWKPYVLAGMAMIAVAAIVIYSLRVPQNRKLLQIALGITLGGILGNFVDRIFRGYVVDFIEFHIKEIFHWPTFNIADSAITIGIVLLLIDTIRNPSMEEKQSAVGSGQ
jgi:signal peptidase II